MLSLKGTGRPPQQALTKGHFGNGGAKGPPPAAFCCVSPSWPSCWGKIVVERTPVFEARPAPHAWMVGRVCGWEMWAAFTGASSATPPPNWTSLWNTWYGGWAGCGSGQDQSGGQKCSASLLLSHKPHLHCQPGFHSYFTGKLQVSSISLFSASRQITLS